MSERFMVDDAGTLIDMHTRDMFDIVEEVCPLLNEQHETIQRLKQNIDELLSVDIEKELLEENKQLKQEMWYLGTAHAEEIMKLKKENKQLKHDLALYEENNTNEVLNQLRIELTSRLNDCIEEFKQ